MRLTLLAVPLAVAVGFVVAAPSTAGATPIPTVTVTFNDLTDSLTVTTDGDRSTGTNCQGELCIAGIFAPAGFTVASSSVTVLIGETGLTSGPISDTLQISPLNQIIVDVFFSSDSDPSTFGNCSPANPCQLVENGSVQLGGTITWRNADNVTVTDTIQFQSDAEATAPEPATMVLLGSGLAITALRRRFSARA